MSPISRRRPAGALSSFRAAACLITCLSVALGSSSSTALAEGSVAHPSGSSFSQLAQSVQRTPIAEPALVAVAPLRGSGLSPEAQAQLHRKLVEVVASVVPLARRRLTKAMSREQAALEARRTDLPLVHLSPSLEAGHLSLTVSVIKWPTSFWQRALNPEGSVVDQQEYRVRADASIRRHLAPPKKLLSKSQSFSNPVRAPLALLCDDVDRDGGNELLIVGRRRIVLGRFQGSEFLVEASRDWDDLSSIAASPLRAPLGSATLTEGGIAVGVSDRSQAVLLNSQLERVGTAARTYPSASAQCRPFTLSGVSDQSQPCSFAKDAPEGRSALSKGQGFDGFSAAGATQLDGTSAHWRAKLESGKTKLTLTARTALGVERKLSIDGVGSAFELADIDGDGATDLVSSSSSSTSSASSPAGDSDFLRVHSLHLDGDKEKGGGAEEAVERASLKLAPVHALTVCPFTGANPLPLVVASGRELLVLSNGD